jgi:hypothetical protein
MITCEELLDRVLNAVDGVEVDAGPRDTAGNAARGGNAQRHRIAAVR